MKQSKPKVALAHDHLFQFGGAEFVLKVLSDTFPKAPIYTLVCDEDNRKQFAHTKIKTSFIQNLPFGVSRFKYFLTQMPAAWEQFDFSGYDVVISSASAFAKGIITDSATRHVCYCHTPTRYLWSDRASYVESLKLPKYVKTYLMTVLSKLRTWDYLAAQRVDTFIANSLFVADRIKTYYNRDSVVIYPPVVTDNFRVEESHDDYYLIVSRLRPYKRVDIAIKAFNEMKIPLVIIGGGEEYSHLKSMAKSNITFLGEVDDETRNKYLRRCKAFIHPQVEDLGISVIEAMASGRPVIAYNEGGARETVLEGVSGAFFDDQGWESLAYAVMQTNVDEFDPETIRSHAKKFDISVFKENINRLILNG